jgi:hypothetical protein
VIRANANPFQSFYLFFFFSGPMVLPYVGPLIKIGLPMVHIGAGTNECISDLP